MGFVGPNINPDVLAAGCVADWPKRAAELATLGVLRKVKLAVETGVVEEFDANENPENAGWVDEDEAAESAETSALCVCAKAPVENENAAELDERAVGGFEALVMLFGS